jgi:hypothetical protein
MVGIAPVYGQRTSFLTSAKIVGVEIKRPWQNLFRKTPVYKFEFETSHITEQFVDCLGKPISPPKSILFFDTQSVFSGKSIGSSLSASLDYADENQQFYQRVHPFHFTIEGHRIVR